MKRLLWITLACVNCATAAPADRMANGQGVQSCADLDSTVSSSQSGPASPAIDERIARKGPRNESIVQRPFCERVQLWRGYVQSLPKQQRDRYAAWQACPRSAAESDRMHVFGGDINILVQVDYDSLVEEARSYTADASVSAEMGRGYHGSAWTLDQFIEARSCAGLPPDDHAMALQEERAKRTRAAQAAVDAKAAAVAAEEARHACNDDPACRAAKDKQELASVTEHLCTRLAQQKDHGEAIREEWRQAKQETGIVDVEYLRRERDLKEIHDEEIYSLQHDYTSLTGKPFNAKKACRAVASR